MKRVFNFSAGPAALPDEVLRTAAEEMLDWHGSGMGVMEMSHRGPEFISICDQAFSDLRELLAVPADYDILFLQGGGIGENAIVPMNLIGRLAEQGRQPAADYVVSGSWSVKSFKEARKYGDIRVVASNETEGFTAFPDPAGWKLNDDSAYVHVCTNETIHGIECHVPPEVGQKDGRVLVADVSSHILSRPMNISRFGAVYGGAQKNIGPAGVTIVIVRKDLLGHALPITPSAFDWKIVSEFGSMYNTPPTYAIYVAGLAFQWIKRQGGLAAIEQRNVAKAKLLYDFIDGSDFYLNNVEKGSRSRMNIPFFLADESRNKDFLGGAKARGMVQLKGHKSVGGMRASIYNAMPLEGVQALVDYMREFERKS